MKLDPADHERFINIELGLEDLILLGDLLRIETIYQIKRQVSTEGEVETRTSAIINAFGVFQDFDTQIKALQESLSDSQKNNIDSEKKSINMVVLSKNRLKIYHFLVTKTTELQIPPAVKKRYDEYGSSLIKRLNEALASTILLDSNPLNDLDVKINMLGQRGIA